MNKYEKKVENRKESLPSGVKVKCEVTEWKDKDGFLKKDEKGEPISIRVIADVAYYSYLELKERYAQGLISDDMLNVILDGDNLRRFCKDKDFVRDVMDTATMDARIAKTTEYEKKWEASMLVRRTNPEAWKFSLNEIVGDIFKSVEDVK